MLRKINDLIISVEQKKVQYDENIANKLGEAIEMVTNDGDKPSRIACELIEALIKVYDKMYLTRVNMPKHCEKNP